jgi:hypothetical protein
MHRANVALPIITLLIMGATACGGGGIPQRDFLGPDSVSDMGTEDPGGPDSGPFDGTEQEPGTDDATDAEIGEDIPGDGGVDSIDPGDLPDVQDVPDIEDGSDTVDAPDTPPDSGPDTGQCAEPVPCTRANQWGRCTGMIACDGTCNARRPEPESCNGLDDNCDGITDPEGAAGCRTYYRDEDRDGHGRATGARCLCASETPWDAILGGDCDDDDPEVNPRAIENCSNGKDDDCDGLTDGEQMLCSLRDALVLHLPLDEINQEGMSPDIGTGGHDAQPVGTVALLPGRVGNALSLEGPISFLRVGDAGELKQGTSRTVSLWFRSNGAEREQVLYQQSDFRDLDGDGHLDVLISNNYSDDTLYQTDSYLYRGGPTGFTGDPELLPTYAAVGNAAGDLDGDGYMDVVLAHDWTRLDDPYRTNIWRGGPGGLVPDPAGDLNQGGRGVSISDLNGDGFMDLVFSEGPLLEGKRTVAIYWGSSAGYSFRRRTLIPVDSAYGGSLADLNGNGLPDLIISSFLANIREPRPSYVFFNQFATFPQEGRLELPTFSSYGNAVADLDGDGFLDLVFGGYGDDFGTLQNPLDDIYNVDTFIYWGSPDGFGTDRRTALPSFGGLDVTTSDFDDNGYLDVAIGNYFDGKKDQFGRFDRPLNVPARVYWGGPDGFDPDNHLKLPANGCHGLAAADLDGDGFVDIVAPSVWDGTIHTLDTRVYWGSPFGHDPQRWTGLPANGAIGVSIPGSPVCGAANIHGNQPCNYGTFRLSIKGTRIIFELGDDRSRLQKVDAPYTSGGWTHVVAAYDAEAGRLRLYVNGIPRSERQGSFTMGGSFPWKVRLGADAENQSRLLGSLDDVRVYDRALTSTEVSWMFANPATP